MTPTELHKLHAELKILSFRDLSSLLKVLSRQNRKQLKYFLLQQFYLHFRPILKSQKGIGWWVEMQVFLIQNMKMQKAQITTKGII